MRGFLAYSWEIPHRFIAVCVLVFAPVLVLAQQDRIPGSIEGARTVVLRGNVNPKAQPKFDRGPVDPSLKLDLVTLALKPTPAQQADLEQLLSEQQDRSSANYHRWLTPEQYAERFGLSPGDIGKVRSWLVSQGFTVTYVARGRNWMTFSGTAAQVTRAFHTEIDRYEVDGKLYFANATEPSIPAALEPVVLGILGLDDFHLKPSHARYWANSKQNPSRPEFTATDGAHYLVPDDIATIYDITRLYQAGFDGSGQHIVVAGQSDISLSDIATFRTGILPANVPQVLLIPGSADPGFTSAQGEADLDVEWIGAVARNAQITYVNSTGVAYSAEYAISENLAPVISFSYTFGCEQALPSTALNTARSNIQQGNVQGITFLVASGDAGAAGCDPAFTNPEATQGLGVSVPASVPEVTAVGGTEFNEGTGNYWSNTNSSTDASALSYIPEMAWNESPPFPSPAGFPSDLAASGGGFSTFYPQPSWQTGPGLAIANARAVPDVALSAAGHDAYVTVSGGQLEFDRGTSAATPVFAGIIALLNQYEGSNGQGNINQNLYRLAQTNIFHDITTGSNVVECVASSPDCTTGSFGYFAGIGYDPVTGLGSVDAYNLVTEWNTTTPVSNVVASSNPDPVYQQAPDSNGYSWIFTLTLNETAGVGTSFTDFTVSGTSYASQIVSFFGGSVIPAHGMISASLGYKTLTVPTTLVFVFSGVDAGGRQWSQQLSVPFNGTQSTPSTLTVPATSLTFDYTIGGSAPVAQSVNITGTSGISFNTTAATTSGGSWLSATPSGTVPSSVSISVNASGLSAGTYNGTVTVTSAGATGSPANIAVTLNVTAGGPAITSVVSGANYSTTGFAPGTIATIFGNLLGPANGESFSLNSSGGLNSTLGGVTVTVEGAPAIPTYVSNGQVNFILPFSLSTSGQAAVQVEYNKLTSVQFNIPLVPADVQIFSLNGSGSGPGAILNQDFSVNTASNPAAPGSVIQIYGTGGGILGGTTKLGPTVTAGGVGGDTLSWIPLPYSATVNGETATVDYAGDAPGLVYGVDQFNVTLPANTPSGAQRVVLTVGGSTSQSDVTVFVK
jgi:uncharacterized protein (TIGR03437 family)